MLIIHVHIHVKPELREAFIQATEQNTTQSRKEPGIIAFDLLQSEEDSCRFILNEVYRTDDDPVRHKETDHYKTWKATVEDMMAVPRRSEKYIDSIPVGSDT